jgi:methylenetetrahydrofolate dehydrogenase (NADP+)/methenyltetrahydrofolate cyclohydrolase
MTPLLINGRAIADEILTGLAAQVSALGAPIQLAAVCVGNDAGLHSFVRIKQKAAQSIGVQFSSYYFDAHQHDEAREALKFLAADEAVHGIFIELPLPKGWNTKEFTALIPREKDVDVLAGGTLLAPAVRALQYVVDAHAIVISGVHVAVVGAGALVGTPVAQWLKQRGASVDVVDVATHDPASICRRADIVIAATGVPGLITGEWIKEGATVIDYGYGKKGTTYVGDVDWESVQKKAGLITPVPGGMGPLVVAAVLENLLALV